MHGLCVTQSDCGGNALIQDRQRLRTAGDRRHRHLEDLSRFGGTPDGAVRRIAFSQADVDARSFCMDLMREAGLEVLIDAARNIVGSRKGTVAYAPPTMVGSHIHTAPNGGRCDGALCSLAAIEEPHVMEESGYRT